MHRSHWDLEVYAKDFQERRRREAAQHRRVDEALCRMAEPSVNPVNVGIARFLATVKSWRSSGSVADGAPAVPEEGMARPKIGLQQRPAPGTMLGKLARPYADMVVVARGPLAGVAEQASGVSEC